MGIPHLFSYLTGQQRTDRGRITLLRKWYPSRKKVNKLVVAGAHAEIRLDLSSPQPEFGWLRVLSRGKSVSVSANIETLQGSTVTIVPEKAVFRDPSPEHEKNHLFAAIPHRWLFDVANNLGFLMYFVNLSEYPVQVGMCQDDHPGCSNPSLPYSVAPMASISFPIDQSRRYAVIESTPGYSVATALRLSEGAKQIFDASSCIKFDQSSSCAPEPLSNSRSTTKFVSPLQQQIRTNSAAVRTSPAAFAAQKPNEVPPSPEKLSELVRAGQASKCVIASEPDGAEVYVDGLKAGVTPVVFVLLKKGDSPRTIEIRMDGYRAIEKHMVPDGDLISIAVQLEKQ